MNVLFKNAKKLSPCLDPLLIPTFREYYSLFHQSEKQPVFKLCFYIYVYLFFIL